MYQPEQELRRKNKKLAEHCARFEVLKGKLAHMRQNGKFVTEVNDGMKINQLKEELRGKNNEPAEHGARYEVLEIMLAAICQDEQIVTGSSDGDNAQIMVNKLETGKGDICVMKFKANLGSHIV